MAEAKEWFRRTEQQATKKTAWSAMDVNGKEILRGTA